MSKEFEIIATYRFQLHAEQARIALQAAGIKAFLHDSHVNMLGPVAGNLYGWIKLQVSSACAAEARALLEASPALLCEDRPAGEAISDDACLSCSQVMPAGTDRCPACGWSFLDEPLPEAEAVNEDDADEN
jgi:hypothetical protein